MRALYATDASMYRFLPLCVVRPRSGDDVCAVVRYCRENSLPLAPRGGGTGLAGESLTNGIVLDFHTYFGGIGDITDGNRVWAEAGVVPYALNRKLKQHGVLFGPDPATSDRCTIGGMAGINSTGSHSLVYGNTADRTSALDVVFSDGSRALLERTPLSRTGDGVAPAGLFGRIAAPLRDLASQAAAAELPFSNGLLRNRHGYLLWNALRDDSFDPAQVVVGSEGTLAVVLRAQLLLDPLPRVKGLVVLKCIEREAALSLVPALLELGPASVEFMDEVLLRLAAEFPEYRDAVAGEANSWLVASFEGEADAVAEKTAACSKKFKAQPGIRSVESTDDPQRQAFISGMREAAVPLLYRRSDGFLPLAFVEDAALPPDRLAAYVNELERILNGYGIEFTAYGHAGPGELHIRPFIKPWEGIELVPRIAAEVFELVQQMGGTVSGEHGDGRLRSFFVRKQYGDAIWELLKETKKLFDPDGIFNPGKKVVEETDLPVDHLRYKSGTAMYGIEVPAQELSFQAEELARSAFACTGCGACRTVKEQKRMCPVFRVLQREEASPRAKLNVLREIASGTLDTDDGIEKVLDLCLWCRSCGRECPSGLSIPEAIIELRGRQARSRGLAVEKKAVASLPLAVRLGSVFPRLYNFFLKRRFFRLLAHVAAGIDVKAAVPDMARRRLVRDPVEVVPPVPPGKIPVAFFADMYADFFDPDLGRSLIALLEQAGCFVVLPRQQSCGIVPLVYGRIDSARRTARRNVERFAPFVEAGYHVVTGEPTAALMFRKDYPMLLDGETAVCRKTFELGKFLYRLWREGTFSPVSLLPEGRYGYHRPCHLFELDTSDGPGFYELLREGLKADIEALPESCCGLSGTFGVRKKYHDVAAEVGRPIFDALKKGAYAGFLSECSSCRMQIEAESGVEGFHPGRFLTAE